MSSLYSNKRPSKPTSDTDIDPSEPDSKKDKTFVSQELDDTMTEELVLENIKHGPMTINDIQFMVDYIEPAIKYDGFNPKRMRVLFLKGKDSDLSRAQKLVLCFQAYIEIGTNVGKLDSNRINQVRASFLLQKVSSIGVVVHKTDNESMTLSRLAISFMPEYLLFRRFAAKQLETRVDTPLAIAYQDLAFAGCSQIRNMNGYEKYHISYSALIYKNGVLTPEDDKTFLTDRKKWLDIYTKGYAADGDIHIAMGTVLGINTKSSTEALKDLVSAITGYRAKYSDDLA
jgi:hypothetical protein